MNTNEDINISKLKTKLSVNEITAMKNKWRNEDPHHFMDKAALRERKIYMRKMRVGNLKECLLKLIRK